MRTRSEDEGLSVDELIADVERLNQEGIAISRPPTLSDSLGKHVEATYLAKDPRLNPDYLCITRANIGYVLRQMGRYKQAQALLKSTLEWAEDAFVEREHITESHGGRGRVLEELGMIKRDCPGEDRLGRIKEALGTFNQTLDLYEQAQINVGREVYTLDQLAGRINRTNGLKGTTLLMLLDEGETDLTYVTQALEYTRKELDARLAAGEPTDDISKHNLANAYHSVGIALTELVPTNPNKYIEAREHLFKAQRTTPHDRTKTTINFRLAWLEYRNDSENIEDISANLDNFLEDTSSLTETDLNVIRPKLEILGNHLGGTYQEKVAALYAPKE